MKCDICRQLTEDVAPAIKINLGESFRWYKVCLNCQTLISRFLSELILEGELREKGLIKPYKFWYSSSRAKRYEEIVQLSSDLTEEQIKEDYLEDWVRENYPNYYGTEAIIHYGFEDV